MKSLRALAALLTISLALILTVSLSNRNRGVLAAQSSSQWTAAPSANGATSETAPPAKPGLLKRFARKLHLSAKPRPTENAKATMPAAPKDSDAAKVEDAKEESELAGARPSQKPLAAEEIREEHERHERAENGGMKVKTPPPFHPDSAEGKAQVAALTIAAGFGEWKAIGPQNFAGKIYQVAVDPANSKDIYAAYEAGGLWGTHDGGQTWLPMFNYLQNTAFSSVATHPSVGGLIAAGFIAQGSGYNPSNNQDVGITLSKDYGATWTNIGPKVDAVATVWEIGFGDTTGQIIYAPTNRGLYKTTNQGQAWTKILAYDGSNDFFNGRPSFAVDPLNSQVLLLADQKIGMMRSTDAGATWTRVDTWMNPGDKGLSTILTWSSKTKAVYAEAYSSFNSDGKATYKSTDEGVTWTATATFKDSLDQGMYDMAIAADPFNPSHVLIMNSQFHVSTDGLQTISAGAYNYNGIGPDALAFTFDPSTSGVVYNGDDEGLKKSTDGGVTWTRIDVGVLASKALGGSSYAVGSDGGIYDNPQDFEGQGFTPGVGWHIEPNGYEAQITSVNPNDPMDIYDCCYNALLLRVGTAAYPSTNAIDPAPTEKLASGDAAGQTSLEFLPGDTTGNTLYFGKQNLYKSTNRGVSWTMIKSDTGINYVKVAPSNTQTIYTYNNSKSQVSYSTDGGATWTAGATINNVHAMAVSPKTSTTVYFATTGGMYETLDGGVTATQLTGFPSVNAQYVVVDPATQNVYASLGSSSGVLVSQDGGTTWQTLGTQLGKFGGVQGQGWMSISKGNLYMGTSAGIYEIPTTSTSDVCAEASFNPSSIVLPSVAATVPLEVINVASCPAIPSSAQSWATISANGQTTGHANVQVTVTDNQAATTSRTDNITLDGVTFPLTQLGGPNPAQAGAIVTFAQSGQCLTIPSDHAYALGTSACDPTNTAQQFTLATAPAGGLSFIYKNAASGECFDIQGDGTSAGTFVGSYNCNTPISGNQTFTLQPQASGQWKVIGQDSLLCLTATPTAGQLSACTGTNTLFTVAQLPATDPPTFSPPAGNYSGPQSVVLSDSTAGAAIYYTTDGSTPTTSSTPYSNAIPVSSAETINAIATSSLAQSAVASAAYTFNAATSQTISFGALPNVVYGSTSVTLGATASSGLQVTYAVTGPATLSGSSLTFQGIGNVTVTASQAGNGTYAAATPVVQSFTVTPAVLTVTANPASISTGAAIPTFTYTLSGLVNGDTSLAVTGTAKETTTATTSSPAGTYPITFSTTKLVANNYTFTYVPGTLTINPLTAQTITFAKPADTSLDKGSIMVAATASSGLAVTFSSPTPNTCSVSGSTVTLIAVGVCTVQADQPGNATYGAAPSVVNSFTINRGAQHITFPSLPNVDLSVGAVNLTATASSGLPVTFSSTTPAVCTVSGSVATLVTVGTCTVAADQAGNSNYLAAPTNSNNFTVKQAKQTITFPNIPNTDLGVGTVTLNATASSHLPVTFSSTTPAVCTVSGNVATLVATGSCTIAADQAGNANYLPAPTNSNTFTVKQAKQTITFEDPGPEPFSQGFVFVTVSSTSGLDVTVTSLTTGVCTTDGTGNTTFVSPGTCKLQGTQAGNANYLPANPVNQSFTITND